MRFSLVLTTALFGMLAACSGGGAEGTSAVSDAGDSGGQGGGAADASSSPADAGSPDSTIALSDAGDAQTESADASDAADGNACEWGGAPGDCITTSACAALGGHTSYPNECPGPAAIECCIVTPSTTLNPPTPAGYVLMQQAQVTSAMTTWAVAILNDPTTYPMFSTTTMVFGTQTVLARVEWHPPDFQNSVVHRGVTLYEPAD